TMRLLLVTIFLAIVTVESTVCRGCSVDEDCGMFGEGSTCDNSNPKNVIGCCKAACADLFNSTCSRMSEYCTGFYTPIARVICPKTCELC
ncbi:hypothetical protein PMAYCL1PPCAC_22315, partial [Pristionchus mayeri]